MFLYKNKMNPSVLQFSTTNGGNISLKTKQNFWREILKTFVLQTVMINIQSKTWDRQAIYKIYWIRENLKLFQIFITIIQTPYQRNTIDWSKNGLQIHRYFLIIYSSASLLRTIAFPGWLGWWGRVPFPKIKSQHKHTGTELFDTFCSIHISDHQYECFK